MLHPHFIIDRITGINRNIYRLALISDGIIHPLIYIINYPITYRIILVFQERPYDINDFGSLLSLDSLENEVLDRPAPPARSLEASTATASSSSSSLDPKRAQAAAKPIQDGRGLLRSSWTGVSMVVLVKSQGRPLTLQRPRPAAPSYRCVKPSPPRRPGVAGTRSPR